jgi:broad specificity phosphatase PhoE
MTPTTAFIVRHAEKEVGDFPSPELGHQDQPISARGRRQAERLAEYLAGQQGSAPITALYRSGYQRTGQTLAPLAERLGLTPIQDPRLNEIDNGLIETMSDEAVQQQYPEMWRAYVARDADFRFPGGETGAEAQQRVVAFMEEKRAQHEGQAFVAVCHEGLIRLLMCALMGLPTYKRGNFQVDPCGILEAVWQQEHDCWGLVRFNQTVGG